MVITPDTDKIMEIKNLLYVVAIFLLSACDDSNRNRRSALDNGYASTERFDNEQGGINGIDEGYPIPSGEVESGVSDDDDFDATDNGTFDIGDIQLTGRIVQCNKCMGYGMVQEGLYGLPQICKFCWISTWMRQQHGWNGFDGSYGQVDAVFNTLPSDYFDELDWNNGGMDEDIDDNESSQNIVQINDEIAWHEKNISQLESQLEYIENSIFRNQIQQQIIEEQYEIRRLRAVLNNLE